MADPQTEKHKKSHKKDKNKDKKRKRDKGEAAGAADVSTPASEHGKHKKHKEKGADTPADAGKGGGGSSKKTKHGGGAGSGEAPAAAAAAGSGDPQQQQQQQPPMPAAPTFEPLRDGDKTLAAFRGARAPAAPGSLQPCWPLEGSAPVAVRPLVPMDRVIDGSAELWVVQLPGELDPEALDGCVISLDEGAARHPERAGVIGSLELSADAAEELELVQRYTLRQEGAAALEPLFVAAPTGRGTAGRLEALRPARRVVVGEDVARANAELVARAHDEAPSLQLYPTAMPLDRANALLQQQGRFQPPPPADGGGAPQWHELPAPAGDAGALLGDVEQDVSIAYKYG
ncbi:hypothetical protein Rsub_08240 [Raphidocelis subcapitata]|uniref:Uncharacterized protein n=1 Tax=Raphidocelis subcapitata TaxID=307507 RepID=A0A2V0P7F3_9CHLO|nr:hypothetical protein Rsub_08240 [Raphidocelis subcapitata]|eukprot:GBF95804.1 hypothetical protein Rsub_08240 [Raphidocelis subcapitata]